MNAHVRKVTMDCYRINAGQEWATICIQRWMRTAADGERFGGEILVQSSRGSYAGVWTACGQDFRRFLCDLEYGYFMDSAMPGSRVEFDPIGTAKNLRKLVLAERRSTGMDKACAREAWKEIEQLTHCLTSNEFVRAASATDLVDHLTESEPWCFATEREKAIPVAFWREIWPHFRDALLQELALELEGVPA